MNEINYKANMLQSEGFKSYLLYHDYCKSERESKRWARKISIGQARAEEKVSGDDKTTERCFTIPFIPKNNQSDHILTLTYQHMTSNATVSYPMRCESHQAETLSSNSRCWHMRGGRMTPSLTIRRQNLALLSELKVCFCCFPKMQIYCKQHRQIHFQFLMVLFNYKCTSGTKKGSLWNLVCGNLCYKWFCVVTYW